MIRTIFQSFIWTSIGLLSIWLIGLLCFTFTIQTEYFKNETPSEAIIVLTGGAFRIETGIDLYRNTHSKYLYISGVHPDTNLIERIKSHGLNEKDLECCVIIEKLAKDTNDNAFFATKWLEKHQIKSATLVTANYHMPRSLIEFKLLDQETELYPFSVTPESVIFNKWWVWKGSRELIIEEYNKFLLAGLKLCIVKLLNLFSFLDL